MIFTSALPASVVAIVAAEPSDDDAFVRDTVARAAAEVEAGRYDSALAILDAAEAKSPRAVFIYVRATIEERRGNCPGAREAYERFLSLDPPESDAAEARRGLKRCPEPAPKAEPQPEPGPPPAEELPPDEPTPRPWHLDPLGGVLLFSGVAGLGTGLGLYVQSRADERAAESAGSLGEYDDRARRARVFNTAGIAVMGVGSALIVGAVIRYTIEGTSNRRAAAGVAASPSGVAFALRARF